MGTGDLIFLSVVGVLVASFWLRTRGRLADNQLDDASHDRKRADQSSGETDVGDGGSE